MLVSMLIMSCAQTRTGLGYKIELGDYVDGGKMIEINDRLPTKLDLDEDVRYISFPYAESISGLKLGNKVKVLCFGSSIFKDLDFSKFEGVEEFYFYGLPTTKGLKLPKSAIRVVLNDCQDFEGISADLAGKGHNSFYVGEQSFSEEFIGVTFYISNNAPPHIQLRKYGFYAI